MECPFEITKPTGKLAEKLTDDLILIGPKKYAFPKSMGDYVKKFHDFQTRPQDVWIYGYARSGTTITQEIVWLIENELNFEKASNEILALRFPYFEREAFFNANWSIDPKNKQDNTIKIVERMQQPLLDQLEKNQGKRLVKTHLPFSLAPSNILESGCKIIYLARNPKDVIVSNYNLEKSRHSTSDFEQYWNLFEAGLKNYCPLFEHIKEGWALRHHKNVLFLFYEDYIKDFRKQLKKIVDFLGKSLTDEQLDKIQEHLKIDNFRKNKSVNNDYWRELGLIKDADNQFIRQGKIGGWREYFKGPLLERVDRWIDDNIKDTDIQFPSLQ